MEIDSRESLETCGCPDDKDLVAWNAAEKIQSATSAKTSGAEPLTGREVALVVDSAG